MNVLTSSAHLQSRLHIVIKRKLEKKVGFEGCSATRIENNGDMGHLKYDLESLDDSLEFDVEEFGKMAENWLENNKRPRNINGRG